MRFRNREEPAARWPSKLHRYAGRDDRSCSRCLAAACRSRSRSPRARRAARRRPGAQARRAGPRGIAMGAIAAAGNTVLNQDAIVALGVTRHQLMEVVAASSRNSNGSGGCTAPADAAVQARQHRGRRRARDRATMRVAVRVCAARGRSGSWWRFRGFAAGLRGPAHGADESSTRTCRKTSSPSASFDDFAPTTTKRSGPAVRRAALRRVTRGMRLPRPTTR